MNKIYFKDGFYMEGVHSIPEDAIEITQEYYQELLDGQSSGMDIKSDDNGYPILKKHVEFVDNKKKILAELVKIDRNTSTRTIREAALGDIAAIEKIKSVEAKADELRKQLAELEK